MYGRSFRTISRIPAGRPFSASPVMSATQVPSRMSPPGSTAGVQAGAGILSTAWWQAAVMVMPTVYDRHRPRWAGQAMNSWVPPPESARIGVRRPHR